MDECDISINDYRRKNLHLNIYYNGFIIDHQNKTSPLYREKGEDSSRQYSCNFDLFVPSRRNILWRNI